MKTSKKLLSLFLAVVMVVTTCSVGFTAFAKDNKNSIWTTDNVSAQDAFDSLNGLADEYLPGVLMGIEAVANLVYEQYAKGQGRDLADLTDDEKETIKASTTLTDVLGAVQPLLINLVGSTGQSEFVSALNNSYKPVTYYSDSNYNYLNDRDDAMSYYTLYTLCKTYGTGGDKADRVSKETSEELAKWFEELKPLADLYKELDEQRSAIKSKIIDVAKQMSTYETATLYELQNFNFNIPEDEASLFETYYQEQEQALNAYGVKVEVKDLATVLYYTEGAGKLYKDAAVMYNLVKDGGGKVVYNGTLRVDGISVNYNINDDITIDNFIDVLTAPFLAQKGMTMDEYAASKSMNTAEAESYLQSQFIRLYNNYILLGNEGVSSLSPFYAYMLNGLAAKYGDTSVDDLNSMVAAQMPEGWGTKDCVLTDTELAQLGSTLVQIGNDTLTTSDVAKLFTEGQLSFDNMEWEPTDYALPAAMWGSPAVKEYMALLMGTQENWTNIKARQGNLVIAFAGQTAYDNAWDGPWTADEDGYLIYHDQVVTVGTPNGRNADGTIDKTSVNGYFAEAENYARTKIVAEMFDATLGHDIYALDTVIDVATIAKNCIDKQLAEAGGSQQVALTDEQKAQLNAYYDFSGTIGTEILNDLLSSTISGVINMEIVAGTKVSDIISLFASTPIDLNAALEDIWARLMESPVATIIEVLPVLVVLIDEVLEGMVLNGEGDMYNGFLYGILSGGLLAPYTYDNGSYVGMTQLSWDLNKVLPDVLHWLLEDKDYTYSYYEAKENVILKDSDGVINFSAANVNTADFDHYLVMDQNNNAITMASDDEGNYILTYMDKQYTDTAELSKEYPNAVFNCYYSYSSDIPKLTGVYLVDTALAYAKISDLSQTALGDIGCEAITEIATLFTVAIDEFVATPELVGNPRFANDGNVLNKGLNNIFVALPQLFDIVEDLAADKYAVSKDAWTYCYEGKIVDDNGALKNTTLEKFKSYAVSDDKDRKYDIFDCFAQIFIGDWLNAIVSIFNNVIATDNTISDSLPIIGGLLNALGGLGEQSIITDILNGIFQINRASDYSFTFETQSNGFTGLSKDNAYFLIANIDTLVEVIMNLVEKFNTSDDNPSTTPEVSDQTVNKYSKPKTAAKAKADSNKYSNDDLSNATSLINNLDKMLSSLLSDSTFNDFSLDQTDNILASLVTLLTNYLGNDFDDDAKSIVRLINSYTYYITGSESHKADKNHNVNDKKVYTNDSLTGLVVETYLLIEDIAEGLLKKFDDNKIAGGQAQYNLLVEAIEGLISPDAIAVRLDGYDKVQNKLADYNCWHNAAAQTSRGDYKIKLDWGIKAGDKEAFYDALSSSLRLVTSILGVLLIDTAWYDTVISPVLGAICEPNGIKLESYAVLKKDKEETGYYDATLLAILTPVSEFINTFLSKPATTLVKTLQGVAGLLDDSKSPTITTIIKNVFVPIADEVEGLASIFNVSSDKLLATSPSLATLINGFSSVILAIPKGISLGAVNKDKDGNITQDFRLPLTGNNIIPIINTYLTPHRITLKQFNWNKFSTAKTPAAALVYLLDYALESILDQSTGISRALSKLIGSDIVDTIIQVLVDNKVTSKDILALLDRILEASDSPTLAYWTFVQYLQNAAYNFTYPAGITKAMADAAVGDLDTLVANIFPLLNSLGVNVGGNDLQAVLDKNLFKNEMVTKLAVALYSALDNMENQTIKMVINALGIPTSTKDVAKLLTDKSYGATYSSAAKTISAQSNWKNVKNVNWGFKDGSSNAQQGFINALVAVLRPVINVLEVFLNEGTLQINDAAYDIICSLSVPRTVTTSDLTIGSEKFKVRIAYAMEDGVFALSLREDPTSHGKSRSSTLKLDFKALKQTSDLKVEGGNGYNSAIIPLLEALQCGNIKTYAQYQKDAAKAKDNILLDILNPIVGTSSNSLLSKLVANPFSELTKLIPNIAMYLEADGLVQLVANLLSPVTDILDMTGENASYLYEIIALIVNNVTDEIELNGPIQDLIIPLVNEKALAANGINIVLPNINWEKLIDLGTPTTYTSKATGSNGKYLTGKMVSNVDQGKVLITVLRYIGTVLVDNASAIKNLICSIDGVKKNDLIVSIIKSVFNTIGTSSPDAIIAALFYILESEPTNAFWDYTKYKTGEHNFTYPDSVDTDFLKNLPPMLDGLIGGLLDLNGLINDNLFKDELISKLATGLYGAIDGVKINDNMNLTALLAQTDIDFSTSNVAKLLTNEKYGKTYADAASVIASAGSWKNVKVESLKWGVTDRDSFFHALVAVLRPIYGVLDVLLNDADLGLFDLVRIPGSNGYTSSIIPLLEAFSCYNVKTQYQYRQDINKEYDAILLDIINPIWDKVEDVLNAPLQTVTSMIPNLALFIGNDGLCQIIDNLLTPVSALADALRPIVDLNSLLTTVLSSLKVDLNGLLAKVGVTNFSLDVYDLNKTLKPLLSGDAIIPLLNNILGMIDIKGTKLGIKLNPVDWLQLASHGQTIVAASQAPTFGTRIFVEGDSSETLIAILRYLIVTVNTGDNFDNISSLIGGLLGGASDNISSMVNEVLGMLEGDTDEVIASLVNLLQSIAG